MSQKPFFSILVPTYNQAEYLGEALDSLLAQTDADWEAVVVNDGSTDETAQVLDRYASNDSRIKLAHKKNGGVSSALNQALKLASGKWICWLSSDDLFVLNKLELHRATISAAPVCRFHFTHFQYLDNSTKKITSPRCGLKCLGSSGRCLEC